MEVLEPSPCLHTCTLDGLRRKFNWVIESNQFCWNACINVLSFLSTLRMYLRTYVHTVNAHVHLYVFNLRTIHVLHIPKVCYIVISIACLRFSQILRNMLYRGSEVSVYVRTCTCVFTCTLCVLLLPFAV